MDVLKGFCIILLSLLSVYSSAQEPLYSFFAAGHAYGSPLNVHYGLHYPFVDYIPTLNAYPTMEFGVFTGDVVFAPDTAYWDSAQIDLDKLTMPYYIAAGNHDVGDIYVDRHGPYHRAWKHNKDLVMVTRVGYQWNITGDVLDFWEATFDSLAAESDQIFIFMHELIWWDVEGRYSHIDINYEPHFPGTTNFETTVLPFLQSYDNQITIYTGDVGATNAVSPFMYDIRENVHLIASGMGGGVKDNVIITDVYADSLVYNLVAINGDDPNALGELKNHVIASVPTWSDQPELKAFPNPFTQIVAVDNPGELLKVYSINGKLIQAYQNLNNESISLGFDLLPGAYLLESVTEDGLVHRQKIIKQ